MKFSTTYFYDAIWEFGRNGESVWTSDLELETSKVPHSPPMGNVPLGCQPDRAEGLRILQQTPVGQFVVHIPMTRKNTRNH